MAVPDEAILRLQVEPHKIQSSKSIVPLKLVSCKDLFARADAYSDLIGSYARRLAPDPKRIWSDIRRVYRLLGACETYGSEAVEEACRRALELEVVDIKRIEGMLEKGLEKRVSVPTRTSPPARAQLLAFERPRSAFAVSTEVDR